MSKKVVVRVSEEMHGMVQEIADAREVPFADALVVVLRAGYSRVRALDQYALVKSGHLKKVRARKRAKK